MGVAQKRWRYMRNESDSGFFVLESSLVTWCPTDRRPPEAVPVEDLVALLAPADDQHGPSDPPTHPARRLVPGRATAARLVGGRLTIYSDRTARWVLLGPDHLRLLAMVGEGIEDGAAIDAFGPGAPSLADDLVEVGCLRLEQDEPVAHEEPEATAPDLSAPPPLSVPAEAEPQAGTLTSAIGLLRRRLHRRGAQDARSAPGAATPGAGDAEPGNG